MALIASPGDRALGGILGPRLGYVRGVSTSLADCGFASSADNAVGVAADADRPTDDGGRPKNDVRSTHLGRRCLVDDTVYERNVSGDLRLLTGVDNRHLTVRSSSTDTIDQFDDARWSAFGTPSSSGK